MVIILLVMTINGEIKIWPLLPHSPLHVVKSQSEQSVSARPATYQLTVLTSEGLSISQSSPLHG